MGQSLLGGDPEVAVAVPELIMRNYINLFLSLLNHLLLQWSLLAFLLQQSNPECSF